jgi:tetratricopeptide (TPR) repeat protein
MKMRRLLPCSEHRRNAVVCLFILTAGTLSALAAGPKLSPLERAQELNAHGNAAAAISILEPLIRNSPDGLGDDQRGVAWSMLGYAHQSMGQYEVAQQCYEAAIRLLKTVPAAEERYAAALENLASIEGLMHQPGAARTLNLKAKRLYQKHRDYDGMARVDTWMAGIALARNNMHEARNYLNSAFSEARQAPNQCDGVWAAMYAVEGNLAAHSRDYSQAVAAYQRSIDCWTKAPQWEYDVVAWEHALRGDANREIGDFPEAAKDFQTALALLDGTAARSAPVYFQTELLYARLLRATGEDMRAKLIEAEANASIESLRLRQCNGCSVSIDSLR